MTCPKCHAAIETPSNFCPNCGVGLRKRRSIFGWITAFAICAIITVGILFLLAPSDPNLISRNSAYSTDSELPETLLENPANSQAAIKIPVKPDDIHMQLPTGITAIYDIAGNLINEVPATAVANGWMALPADVCIGGYFWQFTRSNGDVFEIAGGIIGEKDEVGIWQFRNDDIVLGPQLSAWIPGKTLRWTSAVSQNSVTDVSMTIVSDQRYVFKIAAPSIPDETGVFTQDNQVVGWTFGGTAETGFLWNGLDGENLVYDISVYDYYRATFENGREEQFILALAQSNEAPVQQLAAFANAFLLVPKLAVIATPRHLRPANIIPRMQALVSDLTQNGQYADVADAFDGRKLAETGDMSLVIAAVGATLKSYGFESAVDLIESVQSESLSRAGNQGKKLEPAHKQLYRQWLTSLIQGGDIQMAQQIYDRAETAYTQDPQIHLLGVELALASGDWPTAQQLLAMQVYPSELSDKVALLKSQIAAERSEEGKIVVRFNPGSRQIPVTAYLGDGIEQSFLIDTGATIVTIPRSTAEKLGVSENYASSRRRVQTAGGFVDAYEVVLPSVQLGDSLVENVSALVLDLPNQPSVGLLGMNYLSLFRMNINTDLGVMTLAPR